MSESNFDAIVIGAGVGGMCAAARLTGAGMRVALLEKSPYLGGRCGHRVREDCLVTTGALMVPMGPRSAIREAFDAVGVDMDMVDLTGRMRYRLAHGDYDTPPGGGGLYGMIEFAMQDEGEAKAFFQHFQSAKTGFNEHFTVSRCRQITHFRPKHLIDCFPVRFHATGQPGSKLWRGPALLACGFFHLLS